MGRWILQHVGRMEPCNHTVERVGHLGVMYCAMGLLVLIGVIASAFATAPREPEPKDPLKAKKPDWDLLEMRFSDGERLTRVRVTMYKVEYAGFLD